MIFNTTYVGLTTPVGSGTLSLPRKWQKCRISEFSSHLALTKFSEEVRVRSGSFLPGPVCNVINGSIVSGKDTQYNIVLFGFGTCLLLLLVPCSLDQTYFRWTLLSNFSINSLKQDVFYCNGDLVLTQDEFSHYERRKVLHILLHIVRKEDNHTSVCHRYLTQVMGSTESTR